MSTPEPIPEPTTLSCGCFIRPTMENGLRTLMVSPCHLGCVNVANALGLADEKGVPVEFREG